MPEILGMDHSIEAMGVAQAHLIENPSKSVLS